MRHTHTPGGHLTAGTVLEDRYEITGFLGAGGFALVYKAREKSIGREVAIKILSVGREGADLVEYEGRFMREAQTAGRIRHPNVVTVHGFGVLENQPYIVMELLDGYDLADELKKLGPMEPARALKHFCDILDALGEAHHQGIIHKDLKPANLFIHHPGTRREAMKVLDFGIARIGPKGGHLTTTGQLMGTPRYYAPEYIKNQVVTPSLDVYQMGLILVEAFTGKPVVGADDPYVCLMRHSNGELEVPDVLLDSPLGPVIMKALDGDHQARFLNGHEFRKALEAIDPATIPVVPPDGSTQLVSEISGSIDSFAFNPSVQTGSMLSPASDSGNISHPDAVYIDADGFASQEVVAAERVVSRRTPEARAGRAVRRPEPAPAVVSAVPSASRRGVRWGLLVAAALGLFVMLALGGAAAYFWGDFSSPGGDPVVAPDTPVEAPETPSGPVEVRLITDPSGARVYIEDKAVGRTPYRHEFKDGQALAVPLRLQLSGYEDQEVVLEAADGASRQVVLSRRSVPEVKEGTKVEKGKVRPGKEAPKASGVRRPRSQPEVRKTPPPRKTPGTGSGKMKLPGLK